METRGRATGLRSRGLKFACFLPCIVCFMSCILLSSPLQAQDEEEDEGAIELPPVSIEVLDTTRLEIPREKFKSFMKPDTGLYTPLTPKERAWYVPSTSIPDKFQEKQEEKERSFLVSATAQFGIPQALMYQMLLVRGFNNSEALLDVGRSTLWEERTPELVGDTQNELGDSTIDKLKGAFTHEAGQYGLKADAQYEAKRLEYLSETEENQANDRILAGIYGAWDQGLPNNVESSMDLSLSRLGLSGVSDTDNSGLKIGGKFGLSMLWPGQNPIDAGLGVEYFNNKTGEFNGSPAQDFREILLRASLEDRQIRLNPFILGIGLEFLLDSRDGTDDGSADEGGKTDVYVNPRLSITSQLGSGATLKLGVDRNIPSQDFRSLYLDRDYVQFNPGLALERTWHLNAVIEYRPSSEFALSLGAFDKEVRNLTVFEKVDSEIVSWMPDSRESARIFGFRAGLEMVLLDGLIENSLEYIHEEHDQDITYRPKDIGRLNISFFAPFDIELSLSGDFYGIRYMNIDEAGDGDSEEALSSYFLLKPRISRAFGKYASIFLMGAFYIGEDDYQIWKGYGLPDQEIDFGLTLKF